MKTFMKKTGGILGCIFEIIVGILLLINPISFTAGILITVGIVLAIMGIVFVVNYFRTPIDVASKEQYLMKGLVLVLLGGVGIFANEWLIVSFPILSVVYGIIMLMIGLSKVQLTVDTIRKKEKRWFLGLISSALSILCAFVVLLNPFSTTVVLWMFTGISIIVDAVFDIFAILFSEKKKDKETNT